jgi:hypothetical protein
MRRLVLVLVAGIVVVVGVRALAARESRLVLADQKCSMTATDLSAFELKNISAERVGRSCSRIGTRVVCDAKDEHGRVEKETYEIALEEPTHVMAVANETQSVLMIDWSRSRYVWTGSSVKPGRWLVTQKQCVGTIAEK